MKKTIHEKLFVLDSSRYVQAICTNLDITNITIRPSYSWEELIVLLNTFRSYKKMYEFIEVLENSSIILKKQKFSFNLIYDIVYLSEIIKNGVPR